MREPTRKVDTPLSSKLRVKDEGPFCSLLPYINLQYREMNQVFPFPLLHLGFYAVYHGPEEVNSIFKTIRLQG